MADYRKVSHCAPVTLDTADCEHGQSATLNGNCPQGTTLLGVSFHIVNNGWNFRPGFRSPLPLDAVQPLYETISGTTPDWSADNPVLADSIYKAVHRNGSSHTDPLGALTSLTISEIWYQLIREIGITIGPYQTRFKPALHAQYQAAYDAEFREACKRSFMSYPASSPNTGATTPIGANPQIINTLSGGPGRDVVPPLFWYFGPSSDLIGNSEMVLPPAVVERGNISIDVAWGTGYAKNLTRVLQTANAGGVPQVTTYTVEDQLQYLDLTNCATDSTKTQLVVKLWVVPSSDWVASGNGDLLVFTAKPFARSVAHGDRIAVTFDGIRPTQFVGNVVYSGTYIDLFADAAGCPQAQWSNILQQPEISNQFGPLAPWSATERMLRPNLGVSGVEINGMNVDPICYIDSILSPLPLPLNVDFDKYLFAGGGALGVHDQQNPTIQISFDELNPIDATFSGGTATFFSNLSSTFIGNEYGFAIVKV